jgi:hypothetical protein
MPEVRTSRHARKQMALGHLIAQLYFMYCLREKNLKSNWGLEERTHNRRDTQNLRRECEYFFAV